MIPTSKLFSKLSVCMGAGLLAISCLSYAKFPNTDRDPTTFLGPTLAMSYTGTITPEYAWSLLGEVGGRNFRINGTFGWQIDDLQRIKLSGEWLWQDITYSFFSGNADRWVTQGAIGALYEHIVPNWGWNPVFRIKGFYSHAPSVAFGTKSGFIPDTITGTPVFLTNVRRVAGSNAGSAGLGLGVQPWSGGNAGIDLSYDAVRYNTVNSQDQFSYGIGGTAFIDQTVWDNFNVGAIAQVRQFYNNYSADINYENLYWNGRWRIGVFGGYTDGKVKLPNTWNIGVNLNYFADCVMPVIDFKNDFKHELSDPPISNKAFLNWVNDPAVYMAQVLAIVDEKIQNGCSAGSPPVSVGTIPDVVVAALTPVIVATAPSFSGTGLSFTATGLPAGLTIDPNGGTITGIPLVSGTFVITVVAANSCGAAVNSFTLTVLDVPPG